MADPVVGALQTATKNPQQAAIPQEAAPPQQEELGYDFAKSQRDLEQQRANVNARRQELLNLANTRKNLTFDPNLLAVAQGLLAPTKTGGFGESLGMAAGNLQQAQAEEAKRQEGMLRMQYELEQSGLQQQKEESEFNRQNAIRNLSSKLYTSQVNPETGEADYKINPTIAQKLTQLTGDTKYLDKVREDEIKKLSGNLIKFSTDDKGIFSYSIDPNAAQKLMQLTGDTRYADRVISDAKQKTEKQIASTIFSEKETVDAQGNKQSVFKFNPQALISAVRISEDPVGTVDKYMKLVPSLRGMGMVEGLENQGTPFDAISTMALSPTVKAQAKQAAERYKKGLIKDDAAEKLAEQLIRLDFSHEEAAGRRMDRQAQLAQSAAIRGLSQTFQQEKLEEVRKVNEQKKVEKANQSKAAFEKADDTIRAVEEIRTHPGRASGITQAIRPTQLVPGTEAYNFNEQLNVIKSKSFLASVNEMRGLGALSNKEGDKITDSISRLNPKMSEKEFDKALDEIVTVMNRAKKRSQDIAEGRMPTFDEEKPAGKPAEAAAPRKFTVIR